MEQYSTPWRTLNDVTEVRCTVSWFEDNLGILDKEIRWARPGYTLEQFAQGEVVTVLSHEHAVELAKNEVDKI